MCWIADAGDHLPGFWNREARTNLAQSRSALIQLESATYFTPQVAAPQRRTSASNS